MKWILRLLVLLLALIIALGAAAWFAANWWLDRPMPLRTTPVEVSIEPGTSPRAVADTWVAAGVLALARSGGSKRAAAEAESLTASLPAAPNWRRW